MNYPFVKILTVLFLLFAFENSKSQISFCESLGVSYNEQAYDMVCTSDGGFAITGDHDSTGFLTRRCYLIKTNSAGNILWSRSVGGGGMNKGKGVAQTLDRGIVMAGVYSASQGGVTDVYVVKFDSAGNLLWTDTIGGAFDEGAESVCATSDGGCAISGYSNSFGNAPQIYVIKLNASGAIQWSGAYGTNKAEESYCIRQTSDGGFIVSGMTTGFSASWDGYLLKLDASGNLQWNKVIGNNNTMYLYSVIQTSDGGYAATGELKKFGTRDLFVVKLDNLGNQQWAHILNRSNIQTGYDLVQNTNSDIVVTGMANNFGAYGMLVKFNINGIILWENQMGDPTNSIDLRAIVLTPGGNLAVAGNYSNNSSVQDVYLGLLSSNGTNCCTFTYTAKDTLMAGLGGGSIGSGSLVSSTNGSSGTTKSAGAAKNIICNLCGGMTVGISANNTSICYGAAVTLTATVSGGTGPFTYLWVPGGQNTSTISVTPQKTTTYSVTVTNSSGTCSITKFLKIKVGPVDSVSQNPFICPGYSTVLTAYGNSFFTWSTGATTNSITVTPLSSANYTLNATDVFGCNHVYSFSVTVGPCPTTGKFCATYLASTNANSWAYALTQTPEGGYLMSGQGGYNKVDMEILKIDAQGTPIWSWFVGNICSGCTNHSNDAFVLRNGNYVASGWYSNGTRHIAYLVCFDPAGNVLWRNGYDFFNTLTTKSVIETKDKGFLIGSNYANTSPNYILLVKTDSTGALQWTKSYNDTTSKSIGVQRIVQTPDGGYAIGGGINQGGQSDFFLMKLDAAGNIKWHKTVGGTADDLSYDMIQTKDKGFVLSGATFSYGFAGGDMYLVKLDSTGQLKWTRTLGYNYNMESDYGMSVVETSNGALMVAGSVAQSSLSDQGLLAKFDANGNYLWSKITNAYKVTYNRIVKTSDGGFAMAGLQFSSPSSSEFYFSKTDSLGQSCCLIPGGGTLSSGGVIGTAAVKSTVTVIAVVNPLTISQGFTTVSNCNPVGIQNEIRTDSELRIYPNPSKDEITIELETESENNFIQVYDMIGNLCMIETLKGKKETFSLSQLKSGAYFFSVFANGNRSVNKVMVMKD